MERYMEFMRTLQHSGFGCVKVIHVAQFSKFSGDPPAAHLDRVSCRIATFGTRAAAQCCSRCRSRSCRSCQTFYSAPRPFVRYGGRLALLSSLEAICGLYKKARVWVHLYGLTQNPSTTIHRRTHQTCRKSREKQQGLNWASSSKLKRRHLNSSCCWEYTKRGLDLGSGIILVHTVVACMNLCYTVSRWML